jgi:hypothetical protein
VRARVCGLVIHLSSSCYRRWGDAGVQAVDGTVLVAAVLHTCTSSPCHCPTISPRHHQANAPPPTHCTQTHPPPPPAPNTHTHTRTHTHTHEHTHTPGTIRPTLSTPKSPSSRATRKCCQTSTVRVCRCLCGRVCRVDVCKSLLECACGCARVVVCMWSPLPVVQ